MPQIDGPQVLGAGDTDEAAQPRGDWGQWLVAGLALAAFVFSWTSRLGGVNVVIQMAIAAALISLKPVTVLEAAKRCWPLLLVGLLASLSTLWSDESASTLRYGLQLTFTALSGVAVAAVTSERVYLRCVFFSAFTVLLICIASGRTGPSEQGPVLIGILGSKNVMAVLAQLTLASALAVLFDHPQGLWVRVAGLAAVVAAVIVLATGRSAGGMITAVLGVALLGGFGLLAFLTLRGRVVLGAVLVAMMAPLIIAAPILVQSAQEFSTTVLDKDPGLTGRDYLWAFADRLIADRPILGHGFRAIWMGHDSTTLGLLRWANLEDGRGFHFHDTYREWAVDFGLVGAALIIAVFAVSGLKLVIAAVVRPSAPTAFMAAMILTLAVRAKVENMFLPFAPSTLLLFSLAAGAWLASVRQGTADLAVDAAVKG